MKEKIGLKMYVKFAVKSSNLTQGRYVFVVKNAKIKVEE